MTAAAADGPGGEKWSALPQVISSMIRFYSSRRTDEYEKLWCVFAGNCTYMNMYALDRATHGGSSVFSGQVDGTMKWPVSQGKDGFISLNFADFCLHSAPYLMKHGISGGNVSEQIHKASELFRTASLTRMMLRKPHPTNEHEWNHSYNFVLAAAGDVQESERMMVCMCSTRSACHYFLSNIRSIHCLSWMHLD